MRTEQSHRFVARVIILFALVAPTMPCKAGPVADHTCVEAFDDLPDSLLAGVRDGQNIFYGHTSHGSQLITGLQMLNDELGASYSLPTFYEVDADLGENGDLTWETTTRAYLADHPECTLVMWSWCGGVSTNTDEGVDIYLEALDALESDFPSVGFVYMTGHLDGTGDDGLLRHNNDRIRAFCTQNNKTLYDFANIESWDPDGVRYPDETDACSWCTDWCAEHECPDCSYCAHSHCFNCYRKGKALWWLLAQLEETVQLAGTSSTLDGLKALFR